MKNKKIDLSKDELHTLYAQYAKQNGYIEVPPTITQFVSDDYYLGGSFNNGKGLYPYWRKKLIELYPTPFYEHNTKKLSIFSGATGTGKCLEKTQEIIIKMNEEDIKKYNLEEYIIE